MSSVDRTKLNALIPNLEVGQIADPELRQAVFEEIYNLFELRAVELDVLLKTNTTAYTPTADYHPATKKFVSDEIVEKTVYKTNTTPFTPTADYHPATLKYVIDSINAAITSVGSTAIIQTGTVFPSSPTGGQSFFKSDENRLYVYSGTAWEGTARQDYTQLVPYAAVTGAANTYAATLVPAPLSYAEGMAVSVKINVQNTGASTINVNSLGAKSIKKSNGSALSSGNLVVGSVYTLRYNGTDFILQGEGGEYGDATASDVVAPKTIGTGAGLVAGTITDRGTTANQTLTNQNQSFTVNAGYHRQTFSVTATYVAGKRFVSGSISVPGSSSATVTTGWLPKVAEASTSVDGSAVSSERADNGTSWAIAVDSIGAVTSAYGITNRNATGFTINRAAGGALTFNYYAYEK